MTIPASSASTPWRIWFLRASALGMMAVVALGVGASATSAESVILGDMALYEDSMTQVFAGHIPYVEFAFEHMPLSILPMAFVHALASLSGISFVLLFGLLSLLLLLATGELVSRIGLRVGVEDAGHRWVLIVAPILPLVMFRIDALSVVLASAATLLAMQNRPLASFLSTTGGILAKGWPIVGAASAWWRGRRKESALLVGGTVLLSFALLATLGFRSGRTFVGVHQETLIGAVVATARAITGRDLGLVNTAGATYIEIGRWALLTTLAFGAALAVWSLRVLRTHFSWLGSLSLTAALTFSLILGSPLLSAQFVLWPMPFVALSGSRNARIALSAAGGMSMLLVGYWLPESAWWHVFVVARNAALVAAAIFTMRDLQRHSMHT